MSFLKAPEKVVLSQSIYQTLRSAILDGSLAAGTRLVEESLARQLGVSRAPLRESILSLKRDGLVVDAGPRSTRVVSLSEEEIHELHIIRTMLEALAYQRAAQRITEGELAELARIVDDMDQAAAASDSQRLADLDYAFHQALCRASQLDRVVAIWEQQQVLFRLWLTLIGGSRTAPEEVAGSHRELLEVIRSRDSAAIGEHVIHHVYEVGGVLLDQRREWAAEQPRLSYPEPTSHA